MGDVIDPKKNMIDRVHDNIRKNSQKHESPLICNLEMFQNLLEESKLFIYK